MARVRSLSTGDQSIKVHPTEVDCFYQVIADRDGGKLLHLSTFGSDDRKLGPKSSQSLQIDERMARELSDIIRDTFGID